MIATEKLTLSYDGQTIIVSEISLSIPSGSVTTLVGPNGCGKSTLLKGMTRLLNPLQGCVYLSGKDIHLMKSRDLARQLGILPQSPDAPEGLTVHELVAQGRYPHQNWLRQWNQEDEQAVEEALSTSRLSDIADRPMDSLSGGQRQRAWIAMALAQQSETLLLDEPTTYLDMSFQVEILDLLAELNDQGHTIVMVLHDLNQAARYSDLMVAMKSGEIKVMGSPLNVMTEEHIYDVFGLRNIIMTDPVTNTPMCVALRRYGIDSVDGGP